jgi:hypothetical protein
MDLINKVVHELSDPTSLFRSSLAPPPSPLCDAAERGDVPETLRLLDAGASPDERRGGIQNEGRSALHVACAAKQGATTELLLLRGASPNPRTYRGLLGGDLQTPLHVAATFDAKVCVRVLLAPLREGQPLADYVADPNAICRRGFAPLHYSAKNLSVGAIEALIECPVTDVLAQLPDGRTAIDLVIEQAPSDGTFNSAVDAAAVMLLSAGMPAAAIAASARRAVEAHRPYAIGVLARCGVMTASLYLIVTDLAAAQLERAAARTTASIAAARGGEGDRASRVDELTALRADELACSATLAALVRLPRTAHGGGAAPGAAPAGHSPAPGTPAGGAPAGDGIPVAPPAFGAPANDAAATVGLVVELITTIITHVRA